MISGTHLSQKSPSRAEIHAYLLWYLFSRETMIIVDFSQNFFLVFITFQEK